MTGVSIAFASHHHHISNCTRQQPRKLKDPLRTACLAADVHPPATVRISSAEPAKPGFGLPTNFIRASRSFFSSLNDNFLVACNVGSHEVLQHMEAVPRPYLLEVPSGGFATNRRILLCDYGDRPSLEE
ncbi:hypothetical protein BZG36_00808 [Bifiguratus adelaidae]|uniref:Uncharacterized protein n=1 Tax=Bifiguratus adelaidae TaxID=1938954 RepID=A0A261Y6K1_9FUNG|nr:hypothetical protein BZG36_00808 [Bifiguratus adelaidae]